MKISKSCLGRRSAAYGRFLQLEFLEQRTLLSAATAGGVISPLARLPNESALSSPTFSNEWYFNNVGQTITNASMGPSTGTPGADINATDAWDLTTGSNNVVIAVFDTGADLNDPDLAANIWTNPAEVAGDGVDNDGNGFVDDVHGWNFVDGNNNIQDVIGHGTTTNGAIGAVGNNGQGITGVAWNVKLLEVKIGDATGVSDANLVAGINYVDGLKQRGVNIVAINASYFSTGALSLSDFNAIKAAGNNGILYVAASGNSGLNLDSFIPKNFLPSNMIFVAATDAQDQLASFSDYGANSVALGAPGVDITTTVFGGFDITASGTSYSAPMVSGTLALMKSLVPSATMTQLKTALLNGTDPDPALVGKTTFGRLDAFRALELLQGQQAPIGVVDAINSDTVSGWAFDANAGAKPVTVGLAIDGTVVATTAANMDRPDLTAGLGSSDHGYSFNVPALSGTHTVSVVAADYDPVRSPLANVSLGASTLTTASAPIGSVDVANGQIVAGWAIDRDTPTSAVVMQFNIDGNPIGTMVANNNRPDLTAAFGSPNHGFSITLPTLTGTFHRLDVYALDTTTSAPTLIASRTISGNVNAVGSVDSFDGATLTGWAADPDSTSTALQVEYTIDGGAPLFATASLTRNDLAATFGASHGFSITLPQLPGGSHTVNVFAVDADTKALIPIGSKSAQIVSSATLPTGSIDVASGGVVSGWAFDANAGATPIQVRIDVDGVAGTPFLANLSRPDLNGFLGSSDHGFSQNLTLSAGAHTIDVYAIGSPSSEVVLLGRKLIDQSPAIGVVDIFNGSTLAGWAVDPDTTATSIQVEYSIDGGAMSTTTANVSRPDLVAAFGSANHGFNVTLPQLAVGSHTVQVWAVDADTGALISIGTRTTAVVNPSGRLLPFGAIDVANTGVVSGWAFDPTSGVTPIQVRVDVDGVAGTPFLANQNRNDLALFLGSIDHGYSQTLTLTPGAHSIEVYAIGSPSDEVVLLGRRLVEKAAVGSFDSFDGTTLSGWALDPDNTAASINVQYTIDGGAPTTVAANLSRPDLIPGFGSANHGFTVVLPQLAVGTHTVAVSAVDADTGEVIPLGTRSATIANPTGSALPFGAIDVATTGVVSGWAFDPSSGSGAIEVRVDVDGVAGTPFFANANRPDLTSFLGSPSHGFSLPLGLTGEHTVAVYAIDFPSSTPVLLGRRLVGQAASTGSLDVLTGSTISGWAFNAGAGSGPVLVRLDIDGIAGGPVITANQSRPDLTASLGSANHGFTFTTPLLSAGSHTVALEVLDPVTLQATSVMSGTLVV